MSIMATIESPDQARIVLEAASAADAAHDYAEVISLITELVDSDHLDTAERPRVRWMLAEAQFNTGAVNSARGNYEILQSSTDPDFAEAAVGRLKLLAGEVAADQAVADGEVEGLTELNQVLSAATLQLSQGRFEESLELFSQAYRSDDLGLSQAAHAGFGIARSLAGLGRWAEAKEYTDYLRFNAVGTEFEEGVIKLADQADLQVGAATAADDGVSGGKLHSNSTPPKVHSRRVTTTGPATSTTGYINSISSMVRRKRCAPTGSVSASCRPRHTKTPGRGSPRRPMPQTWVTPEMPRPDWPSSINWRRAKQSSINPDAAGGAVSVRRTLRSPLPVQRLRHSRRVRGCGPLTMPARRSRGRGGDALADMLHLDQIGADLGEDRRAAGRDLRDGR